MSDKYGALPDLEKTDGSNAPEKGFERGIEEYMGMSGIVTNRTQAKGKLSYLVAAAMFNAAYAYYTAFINSEPSHAMHMVALFEFLVILTIVLKAAVSLMGIFFCESVADLAYALVQDLEAAGSFSLLWFLPLPAKLIYWYNNKNFLVEEYILDPTTTCLHWVEADDSYRAAPQFRPWLKGHWEHIYKKQFERKPVLFSLSCLPILFGWIFIRIVLPAFVFLCVALALPVALLKLSTLTPIERNLSEWHKILTFPVLPKNWSSTDYFKAFGFLFQMGKIWSPQWIENIGYLRHITAAKMNDEDGEPIVSGRNLQRHLIHCTYRKLHEYSMLDVLGFFAVLDIGTIGKVLNRGFTKDTPFKALHNTKVTALSIVKREHRASTM